MGESRRKTECLHVIDNTLIKLNETIDRINRILSDDVSRDSWSSSNDKILDTFSSKNTNVEKKRSINQKPQEEDNTIQEDGESIEKGVTNTQREVAIPQKSVGLTQEPAPCTSSLIQENSAEKSSHELEEILSPEKHCIRTFLLSDEEVPYPGFVEILRAVFTSKGVSPQAMNTVLACFKESTQKVYNATLYKWWQFRKGKNKCHVNEIDVIEFLQQEMDRGANYERLLQHRAALNVVVQTPGNELIKNFLKGVLSLQKISMVPMPVLRF